MNYQKRGISGAKLFFSHIEARPISNEDLIAEFPSARWIILYREDILAQYISLQLAQKTGRYTKKISHVTSALDTEQIIFNPHDALEFRDHMRNRYAAVRKCQGLGEHNSIWVSYEELDYEPQRLFDRRIFPFLHLQSYLVRTNSFKQNTRTYSEIISNFTAVEDFLAATDFKQLWDSPTGTRESSILTNG